MTQNLKLNLGCGKDYKEGYINIDQYDSTIADLICPISFLEIEDNSADLVEAHQVLEHLNYYSGLFALYEWFRVLKPSGKLIIEIPYLELTFQKFVKESEKNKKELLNWIFGRQKPGMQHKFIAYQKLLEKNLKEIGFQKISFKNYEDFRKRPILRVLCRKPENNLEYLNLISKIMRKINFFGVYDDQYEDFFLDFDEILNDFKKDIKNYLKSKNVSDFERIIKNLIIYHPKIVEAILEICFRENLINNRYFTRFNEINQKLVEIQFSKILFYLVSKAPIMPGKQFGVIDELKLIYSALIDKIFRIGVKNFENNFKELIDLSNQINNFKIFTIINQISFFSSSLVQSVANNLYFRGLKFYKIQNYKESLENFENSLKLDRNNFFTYLNLARLNKKLNNGKMAEKYIQDLKKFLKIVRIHEKEQIKKYLELFSNDVEKNESIFDISRPIEKIYQIFSELKIITNYSNKSGENNEKTE